MTFAPAAHRQPQPRVVGWPPQGSASTVELRPSSLAKDAARDLEHLGRSLREQYAYYPRSKDALETALPRPARPCPLSAWSCVTWRCASLGSWPPRETGTRASRAARTSSRRATCRSWSRNRARACLPSAATAPASSMESGRGCSPSTASSSSAGSDALERGAASGHRLLRAELRAAMAAAVGPSDAMLKAALEHLRAARGR